MGKSLLVRRLIWRGLLWLSTLILDDYKVKAQQEIAHAAEQIDLEAAISLSIVVDLQKKMKKAAEHCKVVAQQIRFVNLHRKCMAYREVRRQKAEKEKADREAAKQQILDDIIATVIATAELEAAETARRNKEEEERRQMELEEKKKADKFAAEENLLEDITATVIAPVVLEAIRLEEVTRKEQEEVELDAALLKEEEAKAANEARKLAAETKTAESNLLDIPVSAEPAEETLEGGGVVSLVPFLPTILRPEQFTSSQATSSVVAELKGFMTQVDVTVEKNVNMVMKTLEETKAKEEFYDNSLATLFYLVKKGEEDRRKEGEERRRLEAERLAREAEEEVRRQAQFAEMLRIAMQGRSPRSPASTSSNPPPPPPP